jgi:hypothetical protein
MPLIDCKHPESPPAANEKTGPFYDALRRFANDSKPTLLKDRGTDESKSCGGFGTSDTSPLMKLHNPALAISDDAALHEGKIPVNATAFKKGYNPYDSGQLVRALPGRRRDLRRLGEWLKLCMQLKNSKQREE